jgi:hypothetical protein
VFVVRHTRPQQTGHRTHPWTILPPHAISVLMPVISTCRTGTCGLSRDRPLHADPLCRTPSETARKCLDRAGSVPYIPCRLLTARSPREYACLCASVKMNVAPTVEGSSNVGPAVVGLVLVLGVVQSVVLLTVKPWSTRCAVVLALAPAFRDVVDRTLDQEQTAVRSPDLQSSWCPGRPVCNRDISLPWCGICWPRTWITPALNIRQNGIRAPCKLLYRPSFVCPPGSPQTLLFTRLVSLVIAIVVAVRQIGHTGTIHFKFYTVWWASPAC